MAGATGTDVAGECGFFPLYDSTAGCEDQSVTC